MTTQETENIDLSLLEDRSKPGQLHYQPATVS